LTQISIISRCLVTRKFFSLFFPFFLFCVRARLFLNVFHDDDDDDKALLGEPIPCDSHTPQSITPAYCAHRKNSNLKVMAYQINKIPCDGGQANYRRRKENCSRSRWRKIKESFLFGYFVQARRSSFVRLKTLFIEIDRAAARHIKKKGFNRLHNLIQFIINFSDRSLFLCLVGCE
jgi:hypothetical protein